jgi:hypothetical protein
MDWDQWQALVNTVLNVWVLASQGLCGMVLVKWTITNMVSAVCHCYSLLPRCHVNMINVIPCIKKHTWWTGHEDWVKYTYVTYLILCTNPK